MVTGENIQRTLCRNGKNTVLLILKGICIFRLLFLVIVPSTEYPLAQVPSSAPHSHSPTAGYTLHNPTTHGTALQNRLAERVGPSEVQTYFISFLN